MVTYFPVPYAAYNNVYTSQKFDVGTQNGAFSLNLGPAAASSACIQPALATGDSSKVFLRHISDNSALSLNTDLYTQLATFGDFNSSASDNGTINMHFKNNLRIYNLNNGKGDYPAAAIKATTVNVSGNMHMLSDYVSNAALPGCKDFVTWQKHTIGTTTGFFLTCGEAQHVCKDDTYFDNHIDFCCGIAAFQNDNRCCTLESQTPTLTYYYSYEGAGGIGSATASNPHDIAVFATAGSDSACNGFTYGGRSWPDYAGADQACDPIWLGEVFTTSDDRLPADLEINCDDLFPSDAGKRSTTAVTRTCSVCATTENTGSSAGGSYLNHYFKIACTFKPKCGN